LYWLTAASMHLFGLNEFGARLPNAAAAMAGLLATFVFALKAFDRRRALIAGVILATSGLYVVMAQVLTTDMLLTALLTIALFALYLHWRDGGAWCWLMYAAMALAVLTKGPVGVAIPLLVGLIFLWWERDLRGAIRRFHIITGILLTAAISLPWFVAMTMRVRGYFAFYFIGENILRFLQPGYSHTEPIYYYLPVIALGVLPWTLLAPLISWRGLNAHPARRFCIIAAAVILVFFSLAHAKLIPYIMPALPPLAVVMGDGLANLLESERANTAPTMGFDPRVRRFCISAVLIAIAGAAILEVSLHAADFRSPYVIRVRPALEVAAAIALVTGVVCWCAFWSDRLRFGLAALIAATTALYIVFSYGRLMATPLRSYAHLARTIDARAPNATLVCYPRYLQSLPFYTRRRVILVGDKTELTFGAARAPDANQYFFKNQIGLLKLWNEPRQTVLVLDRAVFPGLKRRLGAYVVIAADRKKIAVMKPAPALATAKSKDGRTGVHTVVRVKRSPQARHSDNH
ncbi:MAG: glycosyltransferase family 39 protein, partial [Candidatus Binataceae bacterium]